MLVIAGPVCHERHSRRLSQIDNHFLTYTVMLHDWLNQPGYGALFSLSFLASTLIPIGSEWLLAMMVLRGYDPVAAVAAATVGNLLGAMTTWLIGVYGGRWLIERVVRVSAEQEQRARGLYQRYGKFSLLFSWLPVIGDPLCLVGGLLGVNWLTFGTLVGIGKLARYAAVAILALPA